MNPNKKFKCPFCKVHDTKEKLINHIEKKHQEMIPEGFSAARVLFHAIHKRPYNVKGSCVICKGETEWNERTYKYNRLCNRRECKDKLRDSYKKNMLKVYGTYNILNDMEQQEKMLANRSISGVYKFRNGKLKQFVGSYEKKFLEFCDLMLNMDPDDIMMPGPTIEYEYRGEKHVWITDAMIIPYNLLIDVKDGSTNVNNRPMVSYREKQIEKEKVITNKGEYNYLRLTNNEFDQLIGIIYELKMQMIDDPETTKTISRVHEDSLIFDDDNYYYNWDKWKSGGCQFVFLLGPSGAGKSTLGRKIAKEFRVQYIEMDLFSKQIAIVRPDIEDIEDDHIRALKRLDYMKHYLGNKRAVLDGFTFGRCGFDALKDDCIIILGTSVLKSTYRATMRAWKDPEREKNWIKDPNSKIELYLHLLNVPFNRLKRNINASKAHHPKYVEVVDNVKKYGSTHESTEEEKEIIKAISKEDRYWVEGTRKNTVFHYIHHLDNKPVGFIDLIKDNNYENAVYIEFGVHPDYRGKGLARTLMQKAFNWAQHEIVPEPTIIYYVDKRNKNSIEVIEKLKSSFDMHKFGEEYGKIIYFSDPTGAQLRPKNKNSINESSQPIFISEDDLEIKLDDWKDGKIKCLFIAGMSGGGKSTLANNLAKEYDAIMIEMDLIMWFLKVGKAMPVEPPYKLIEWHKYKTHKPYPDDKEMERISTDKPFKKNMICDYLEWVIQKSPKQFVIEGPIDDIVKYRPNLLEDGALIVKGTSTLTSVIRRIKRDFTRTDRPMDGIGIKYLAKVLFKDYPKYQKDMNSVRDYVDNYTESSQPLLISEKDIEYKVDDFKNHKVPILWITGQSGGGKTTIANKIADEMNCDLLGIDDIERFLHMLAEPDKADEVKRVISQDKNYKMIYDRFGKNKQLIEDMTIHRGWSNKEWTNHFRKLFLWLYKMVKMIVPRYTNSNQCIIEGVQIPQLYIEDKSLFKNCAIIVRGTSTVTSLIRRLKRDNPKFGSIKDIPGTLDNIFGYLKMYKDWHKDISEFRNKGPITEAVDIPEIKPEDIQYINGTNGVSNSYIDYKGKHYRVRVETLVINDGKVYLQKSDTMNKYGTKYKIPGGSAEAKCDLITQASNECKEESKLNVKNIYYTGKCYLTNYRPGTEPSYQINYLWPLGFKYAGSLTYIYIAEYNGHYHGYIRKADRDDLYKYGKFYDPKDVKWLPEHKQALDDYFKSHTKV